MYVAWWIIVLISYFMALINFVEFLQFYVLWVHHDTWVANFTTIPYKSLHLKYLVNITKSKLICHSYPMKYQWLRVKQINTLDFNITCDLKTLKLITALWIKLSSILISLSLKMLSLKMDVVIYNIHLLYPQI